MSSYSFKHYFDGDLQRYVGGGSIYIYFFLWALRKCQTGNNFLHRILFSILKSKRHIEIYGRSNIGPGLYLGHPYCITINAGAVIGSNCNIHKGVTIGQENRGARKGAPIIGNEVWIGVNATIVGHIQIGDDVLIAPNSFVNCDIPSHSVVLGNPCVIKHKEGATEGYISNKASIF